VFELAYTILSVQLIAMAFTSLPKFDRDRIRKEAQACYPPRAAARLWAWVEFAKPCMYCFGRQARAVTRSNLALHCCCCFLSPHLVDCNRTLDAEQFSSQMLPHSLTPRV
jgi:hypothetical protein